MHHVHGTPKRFQAIVMALFLLTFSLVTFPRAVEAAEGGSAARSESGTFLYYVPGDAREAMARQYPDGTVGGQCGDFGAKVMGKPFFKKGGTGGLDSFRFKLTLIDPRAGIEGEPVQAGDAIVQDMKNAIGHFAVINTIGKDAHDRIFYVLTESNWKRDGKVSNTRVILADDPSIRGIVRGDGKAEGQAIRRYDDRL